MDADAREADGTQAAAACTAVAILLLKLTADVEMRITARRYCKSQLMQLLLPPQLGGGNVSNCVRLFVY